MKCKSKPVNIKLYNRIKNQIKSRSKVWPSAYASGRLVRTYKSKGGKYTCSRFGSLDRWFKEKWVDVCKPKKNGKFQKCGRSKSQRKKYPYCRPLKRITSKTPKTVGSLTPSKLKKMCRLKQKRPYRRVFINSFGEKNKSLFYTMQQKEQTCGFGRRRHFRFGNNLGPTNSNFDTFYKNGAADSSYLTPSSKSCLGNFYDQPAYSLQRFGKKKFIKEAFKSFERKGTRGSFTRWCKSKGYPKVTTACIKAGKKSKSKVTRKRAVFAENIRSKGRTYRRSSSYSFGKKKNVNLYLKKLNKEIKYEYSNCCFSRKYFRNGTFC